VKKIWTLETIQIEANKYKTRTEFQKNKKGAYLSAIRHNIIDEIFKNHQNQGYSNRQVKQGYWTKDILQDHANKYITKREFELNDKGAYLYAYKNNLLDEIFKNHKNSGYTDIYIKRNYWTEEKLNDIILNYDSRADLYKNNKSAFNAAHKLNIINDLFKNHVDSGYTKMQDGYWTYDKMQEEVNKYKTRKEFRKYSQSAYQKSIDEKTINKLFINLPNEGYSDIEEWKENRYVIYVYEIPEFNNSYIGLTNNVDRRDKEHLFSKNESLINFCKEKNIPLPMYRILESDLCSYDARKREEYWMEYYKNNKWSLININKAGSLGGKNSKKWNNISLQKEVNKYKTRSEFSSKNYSAYNYARKNNLLDEIFKNHTNNGYSDKQKKSHFWTKEIAQECANKYKTRRNFQKIQNGGYLYAVRNNILDEIFNEQFNFGYDKSISNYWTIERLQNEVNRYENRNEFRNKEPKIYGIVKVNKLLDELFKNHKDNGYIRKIKKSE